VADDRAQGALRMTLGHTTTPADIDRAVDVVADSVTQLRRLSVS
jgi:cysteine sulfinate desulfinase/cysteine desulfurase-like protein